MVPGLRHLVDRVDRGEEFAGLDPFLDAPASAAAPASARRSFRVPSASDARSAAILGAVALAVLAGLILCLFD